MAKFKFLLQSTKNPAPIYCRLSLARDESYKRKTGLSIDPKQWSKLKGRPIQKDEHSKEIEQQLIDLEANLLKKLNSTKEVSGAWLERSIDEYFGRVDTSEKSNFLTDYARICKGNLKYKVDGKGKRGVTKSTENKYQTIIGKLEAFDKHRGKKVLLDEMNLNLRAELIEYLEKVEGLSPGTSGRYIRLVKTIARDARLNGISVSSKIDLWKGYTDDTAIIYLKFNEIEKIEALRFTSSQLEAARDWLVISCYTGQRVSDLLSMKKEMIKTYEEDGQLYSLIELTQKKVKKEVSIPIHEKVQAILDKREGEFPPSFGNNIGSASTIYNRLIKRIAKSAGLDYPTLGRLKDESGEKKTVQGEFPKWQLVTSHIGRRSFASNFYGQKKYPTELLMSITGHATEKQFLEYIGQKPVDKGLALARIWAEEAASRKAKPAGIVKSIV